MIGLGEHHPDQERRDGLREAEPVGAHRAERHERHQQQHEGLPFAREQPLERLASPPQQDAVGDQHQRDPDELLPATTGGEEAEPAEDDDHREVLVDEHAQRALRLRVGEQLALGEELGDHARGRDVGDAAQEQPRQPAVAQQHRCTEPDGEVHQVDRARHDDRAAPLGEARGRELEAHEEEQQDEAELAEQVDRLAGGVDGHQAARTEGEAQDDVADDGGEPQSPRDPGCEVEPEGDEAELEDRVHGRRRLSPNRLRARVVRPHLARAYR